MLSEGTISPVEFSEWATPIVHILKADQSVRICVDYKVTINPVTKLDNYPYRKRKMCMQHFQAGHFFKSTGENTLERNHFLVKCVDQHFLQVPI